MEYQIKSFAEVVQVLARLEQEVPVSDYRLAGVDLWPAIRQNLAMRLGKELTGQRADSESYRNRLKEKVALLPGAIAHVPNLLARRRPPRPLRSPSDVLIVTDTFAKRAKIDNRWYDVFIGPIADHLTAHDQSYVILETSQRFLIREPAYHPTHLLFWVLVKNLALSILRKPTVKPTPVFRQAHAQYQRAMSAAGLSRHVISSSELRLEASLVACLARYFRTLVSRIQPRLILLMPYTSYVGKALCMVSRSMNVNVADVQHGVQGPHHVSYAGFSRLPAGGFNVLPTHFLTWTKEDASTVNAWAAENACARAYPLGNAFMDKFREDSAIARHYDAEFGRAFSADRCRVFVLVSLVWSMYLPKAIEAVLERAGEAYFFLIRFHPSTTQTERTAVQAVLDGLKRRNFECDLATALPVYSLLRNVDVNLTPRSTTVLEAAAFGVPSIVTDGVGRSYYARQIEEGQAFFADRVDSILALLDRIATGRDRRSPGDAGRADLTVIDRLLRG